MLLFHNPSDRRSRYSHYLAEILRCEGLIDFAEADIATLADRDISREDLLILPRVALSETEVTRLLAYLQAGGHLIAMLPDAHFVSRLGLKPQHRATDDGYLRIDGTHSLTAGLCLEAVQIIVPAVGWQGTGTTTATAVAHVYPTVDAPPTAPGVVHLTVGAGAAILFAYDLPHTVARLRQGNPAHVDLCYAGLDGIYRPSELFVGQLPVTQMHLPQADIHTALLARMVEVLAPRPRLWYYPRAEQRSVMIMTSDDDWSTLEQFDTLLNGLAARNAHCTFYVVPKTKLNGDLMDQWASAGHTFSVHPALEADTVRGLTVDEPQSRLVEPMLAANIQRHQDEFQRTPRTVRQHAVRWLGYVDAAQVEAKLGIHMDLNYIAVSPYLGHLCGSGRPLRFVDTDGTVIDCFQQPTHWTEECLIHPEFVFSFKWTVERAVAETGALIQRAATEFYTPIALNSHPVSFATYSSPLIEGNWDTALDAGMIILSADDWLAWTEAREQVQISRDGTGYRIMAPVAIERLTFLLPPAPAIAPAPNRPIAIDEPTHAITQQQRWGRAYQAVTIHNLAPNQPYRLSGPVDEVLDEPN
ncbi:MAG TPA: hypothetical protein P5121_07150 [Caldilineaceae bacterium]|nr:hypothetical protein [Caldilineaceae bacterium]